MSAEALTNICLVTVAGSTHLNRDYTAACVGSWRRIHGVSSMRLVSDGLKEHEIERAKADGFVVHDRDSPRRLEALAHRPALRAMCDGSPTWRHLVDTVVQCRDFSYALMIDTDVLVTEPIAIANERLDFIYNCDDIPGFRGTWYLPLIEPMVPAINPGFLVLRPSSIDLDEFEELARRYFVRSKNYWWTRQSALSVLVARSQRRGLFDGNDVRAFSGSLKRCAEDIRQNRWKLVGSSQLATDPQWINECLAGAAVLHLAGRGKKWLHLALPFIRNEGPPRFLKVCPAPQATPAERVLIALRMLAIQAGRPRNAPLPPADALLPKAKRLRHSPTPAGSV